MHQAIKNAFEGLISPDAFPFYVLFIEIDPQRMVYSLLRTAVKRALAAHHMLPSVDPEHALNPSARASITTEATPPQSTGASTTSHTPLEASRLSERNYTQFKRPGASQQGDAKDW